MSTLVLTKNDAGMDTFALAGEPDRNHSQLPWADLQLNAANYYLWWDILRLPSGAQIQSAHLHGYSGGDWPGAVTLAVNLADTSWDGSLTWNDRPGLAGVAVEETRAPGAVGTEYSFDVTALVSSAIASGVFHGFVVRRLDAGDNVRVFQRSSASQFTWWIEIVWTGQGSKPNQLQPQGIVGVPDPLLSGFPKDAANVRVQAAHSPTGFLSPAWESNTQPLKGAAYDLNTDPTWPGTELGDRWWWQASTQGGSGDWGAFSDPIAFDYFPLPELVITAPSDLVPFVTQQSPPITWDCPSQKAYLVRITATDGQGSEVWSSGKVESTDRVATVPSGKLTSNKPGAYRVWVQVWPNDADERVAVPRAQVYAQEAVVFTFAPVPGIPGASSLSATQPDESPFVLLHVDRDAGSPDQWDVWRNAELIMPGVDPTDVDDPYGGWNITDTTAAANTEYEYFLSPVVNGEAGWAGPRVRITTSILGLWLTQVPEADDPFGLLRVRVLNEDPASLIQATAADQAASSKAIGAEFPATVTSAVGYLEGTIQGILTDDPYGPRTALDHLADLLVMKRTPARTRRLHYQIWSCDVTIHDVTPLPYGSSATWQSVTMRFEQVGPWTVGGAPPADGQNPYEPPEPDLIWTYSDAVNGTNFTAGMYDTTAVSGGPSFDEAGRVDGHPETRGWGHGSITRQIPNGVEFTDDVYVTIPSGGLPDGISLFLLKNPTGTGADPADVRFRSGGTIDVKAYDGTVADTADLSWQAGKTLRATLRAVWTDDDALGVGLGWLSLHVALFLRDNGEQAVWDDELNPAPFVTSQPVNLAHNVSSEGAFFEVERYYNRSVYVPPYGLLPPAPPLLPGLGIWAGDTRQTTAELSTYTASYTDAATGDVVEVGPTAVVGLKLSANADMSASFTVGEAGPHSISGWRKWSATGLTVNSWYYGQLTVDGVSRGPIARFKTLAAAGAATSVNLAVYGCKQDNPSSPAVPLDIAAWAPGDATAGPVHRGVNLGDKGYPGDLVPDPTTHERNWALQITDPAVEKLATICAEEYSWSDHDVNGFQAKSNMPNEDDDVTAAGLVAWARTVPAVMDDDRADRRCNYRSYTEGNWRFILYDHRSVDRTDVRENGVQPDDESSSVLGPYQRGRLLADLELCAAQGLFPIILGDTALNGVSPYDSTIPGIPATYSDKWGSYVVERDWWTGKVAEICGTTSGRPNGFYFGSDTHLLQLDDGTNGPNGMASATCGPWHQNLHGHYQEAYQRNYPAGILEGSGHGPYRSAMQYIRARLTNPSAGTFTVKCQARDCTPKISGTPKNVMTLQSLTWTL